MQSRWPELYEPALRWLGGVEASIRKAAPSEQGALIAITNAIEFQLEIGADEATLWHLLEALRMFATRVQLTPEAIGLDQSTDRLLGRLRPEPR